MKALPILSLSFVLTLAGVALSGPKKASPADVFLITIDTLRADHVHCYGYREIATPSLDLLAQDGVRFSEAFTPSPITNTSHATILTGLLPGRHAVKDFAIPLASSHSTLAELLKNRGYQTAAFIGAIILDSKTLAPGLDRGFDFYDNFPLHSETKSRWGRIERRGMDVVERARKWLDAHRSGSRFVWLHLYDPHDPYEPPPPYSKTYKDRLYDGEIAYADSALGHFLRYLKKQGWYRGALIVVVGDHGEGLGEHGEDTHGIFLYDSTLHVPLIIKLPGEQKGGVVVRTQVRTTDILPTVVELVGASGPRQLDGESLTPYLDGSRPADRVAFGETDYPLRFGWAPLRSVRENGLKFIEAPRPELYDLYSDSRELRNQYVPWDARVQKLRASLAEIRRQVKESAQPAPGTVTEGTTDQLRALGYFGPSDAVSETNVPQPSLLPDPKDKIQEQNLLHAAMLASEDKRPAEARSALEKVLEMDPNSATALGELGQLELATGRIRKAIEYLGRARQIRPDDASTAFHYAQALELSGDLASSRDDLLASLKRSPNQFDARLLLGRVYLRLHDLNDAEDQLEAALLLEPRSVDAQLVLAKVLIAQGRHLAAAQQLELLAKSQPNKAGLYDLLGKAYAGLGEKALAESAQKRAKALRSTAR